MDNHVDLIYHRSGITDPQTSAYPPAGPIPTNTTLPFNSSASTSFEWKKPIGDTTRRESGVWVCQTCGLKCLSPATLERHNMTHTGERPFVCAQCGSKFNRKFHLDRHIKTHEPAHQTSFSAYLKELAGLVQQPQ